MKALVAAAFMALAGQANAVDLTDLDKCANKYAELAWWVPAVTVTELGEGAISYCNDVLLAQYDRMAGALDRDTALVLQERIKRQTISTAIFHRAKAAKEGNALAPKK